MALREWILEHNRTDVESYRNLKQFIGYLGMALPIVCIVGGLIAAGHTVRSSISAYYYSNMRDVFVGTLAVASVLFLARTGYSAIDEAFSIVIGIAGIGVASFPCQDPGEAQTALVGILQLPPATSDVVHYGSATVFFLALALNSLVLFPLSRESALGPEKRLRNLIYRISGSAILASMAALGVLHVAAPGLLESSRMTLVLEAVMLLAFGFAWLVKGNFVGFRDRPRVAPQQGA